MDDRLRRRRFRPLLEDSLECRALLSTVMPGPPEPAGVLQAQVVPVARISQRTLTTVLTRVDWAFKRYADGHPADGVLSFWNRLISSDHDDASSTWNQLTSGDQGDSSSPRSGNDTDRGDYQLLMKRISDGLARLPRGYDSLYGPIVNKAAPGVLKPSNASFFRDWAKAKISAYVRVGVREHRFVIVKG